MRLFFGLLDWPGFAFFVVVFFLRICVGFLLFLVFVLFCFCVSFFVFIFLFGRAWLNNVLDDE